MKSEHVGIDELHSHLDFPKDLRKALKPSPLSLLQLSWAPGANLHLPPPPPGSTAPSFQQLQSHWEIATGGESLCLPLAPGCEPGCTPWSRGSGMEASSHWEEAVPSCSPIYGSRACCWSRLSPLAVMLGYWHCERAASVKSGQARSWAHQDFPEAIKEHNVSIHHQPLRLQRVSPSIESLPLPNSDIGNLGVWKKLESAQQPN